MLWYSAAALELALPKDPALLLAISSLRGRLYANALLALSLLRQHEPGPHLGRLIGTGLA